MTLRFSRHTFRVLVRFIVFVTVLCLLQLPGAVSAQDDPKRLFIQFINQVRQREGLAPYDTSSLLNQAAQQHAEDLVVLGAATQLGSDESTPQQRILETRYHAWNDGLMVNELNWLGLGTVMDAVNWFLTDPDAWQVLSDPLYREMGIGFVENNGIRYLVMTLGSRPGVLPIFINDGAEITESSAVAVRLTNEEAVPLGEGTWIGKAIEVRLSNTPDFEGEIWQAWEPLLPWTLASLEPGDYAVYVEFRDGAGRTTVAEDTIRLVAPGEAPEVTPVVLPDISRPEIIDEIVPTPESADEETSESPPSGETETAVPTPAGQHTPEDIEPLVSATPQPTWTPLNLEEPVIKKERAQDWPLLLTLALQAAAVFLGIVAFLKRR